MWFIFSFQILSFMILILNMCTYFENFIPQCILRTVRFGKSGVGIPSKSLLFEVPKSWFAHFYIFGSLLVSFAWYLYFFNNLLLDAIVKSILESSSCLQTTSVRLGLTLITIQIGRRFWECRFVSKFSPSAKMNIVIYLMGFWHYIGVIITILQGPDGCIGTIPLYTLVGILLFAWASYKQSQSTRILASLRKSSTDTYGIPRGGLFEYVTCANYFTELLIYLSLCMVYGFQNYNLQWVVLRTLSSQVYSASVSHEWYLKKFGREFPTGRKRLIPFIF